MIEFFLNYLDTSGLLFIHKLDDDIHEYANISNLTVKIFDFFLLRTDHK